MPEAQFYSHLHHSFPVTCLESDFENYNKLQSHMNGRNTALSNSKVLTMLVEIELCLTLLLVLTLYLE